MENEIKIEGGVFNNNGEETLDENEFETKFMDWLDLQGLSFGGTIRYFLPEEK